MCSILQCLNASSWLSCLKVQTTSVFCLVLFWCWDVGDSCLPQRRIKLHEQTELNLFHSRSVRKPFIFLFNQHWLFLHYGPDTMFSLPLMSEAWLPSNLLGHLRRQTCLYQVGLLLQTSLSSTPWILIQMPGILQQCSPSKDLGENLDEQTRWVGGECLNLCIRQHKIQANSTAYVLSINLV